MTPKRRLVQVEPGPVSLLIHLFEGQANLPGAACAGLAPQFDEHVDDETADERQHRLSAAARTCRSCPVRADCHTAISEQPHPTGIWAGQLHQRGDALRNRRKQAS